MRTLYLKIPKTLFILIPVGAYWCWTIFGNFHWRAFDPADPLLQMGDATIVSEALRHGSFFKWLGLVMDDRTGKPLFQAFLSLGILLSGANGLACYYACIGLATLAFQVIATWTVFRGLDFKTALFFAIFMASSNLELAHALAGTHNWLGQALLWMAIAIALAAAKQKNTLLSLACANACLAMASMASYHLLPITLLVSLILWGSYLLWSPTSASFVKKASTAGIATLCGALAIPAALSLLAAGSAPKGYLGNLTEYLLKAEEYAAQSPAGFNFFFQLLLKGESPVFLAALFIGAAIGIKNLRRVNLTKGAAIFLITPIGFLVFMEASGALKLGRIYLPILPFLFVWGASGAAWCVDRIARLKSKITAGLILGIALSGIPSQKATREAFFAGKAIAKIIYPNDPSQAKIFVAGLNLPFSYLPQEGLRKKLPLEKKVSGGYKFYPNFNERSPLRPHLKNQIEAGEEWILVSYFSTWQHHFFREDIYSNVVPVKKIYASSAPYIAVPGVESADFFMFVNEAIYSGIKKKKIPFPVENRLYRGKDLLPYL